MVKQTKYTIEIEVSYHGDNPPKYFRFRGAGKDEEEVYAVLLGNLQTVGVPLYDEDGEPIHGVKVVYACETEHDDKYLPLYGKATVEL